MRDGHPTLAPGAKPAKRPGRAVLLALAGSLLGLGAEAAPVISSISPESGSVFNGVTITGTGFGANKGTSTVTFAGTEVSRYSSWTDTRMEVVPPAGLGFQPSAVVVTVGGEASNAVDFERLPALRADCGDGTLAEPSEIMNVGISREMAQSGAVLVRVSYAGTALEGADFSGRRVVRMNGGEARKQFRLGVINDRGREEDETIILTVSAEGYLPHSCQITLTDDDPRGRPAPVISQLRWNEGRVGDEVWIVGSNFGATKGSSRVDFNKRRATTVSWSATFIRATVPEGATTGNVVVEVEGQLSNGIVFTVIPRPVISRLNPASGPVGASVEITGSHFGTTKGDSSVSFNGRQAATTGWSATSITATVPEGATTGNVVVEVEGQLSNGIVFTVIPRPVISRLNPASGPVGASVEITGSHFGTTKGDSSVSFNGRQAATTGWSATSITATVPEGATTGNVVVEVEGQLSNGIVFTVIPRPVISRLNPASGPVGASVEITGSHFGTTKGDSSVSFNGRQAATTGWSATSITATVPEGATTGNVVVEVLGQQSDGVAFTVIPRPVISRLNPASGPVGASVEITGSHFGTTKGDSSVSFNGRQAATTGWSATSITAMVPEGATTGNVVVEVLGEQSDGVVFTVTGVTVDPTELTIEEGSSATYTVVLDSKPTSAVTVAMFTPSGTDLSVDILPVFTASNWSRPQTVTVTAGEDEDTEDDTVTITHRTTSADAGYHGLTVDPLVVTIADDDAGPGITVDPAELTIEEGAEGTYTVVLNTEPAAAVTVGVQAGGDLTVSPASLDFTPANWDTPQTVTVTAGEDDDAEDETETSAHAVASADSDYNSVPVDGVKVTVADDEGTGGPGGTEELTVSTTRLRITEGNRGTYTVVLNRAPVGAVTVAVAGAAGGDLTVSPASLDFTTTNWDTPQEVIVTAAEDTDLDDELESITHTITRAAAGSTSSLRGGVGRQAAFATAMSSAAPTREYVYLGGRLVAITEGGSAGEVSVVVTIDDDDDPETPGVPALTNSLTLTEGNTGAYTLELGAVPTADVTIALSVSPGSDGVADVTVDPASLTFTAGDWDTPQWVTVSVGDDSDTVGETETVSHTATSTDSRYQGIEITRVQVVIRDRNRTRIPTGTLTASPSPCVIAAGQTTCSTTLTWTSENTTAVHLRRTEGTTNLINQVVVWSGDPNDKTTYSKIGLTASTFILYDYTTGSRGNRLASVSVKGVKEPGIDPTSGPAGTEVTISGSGFGATQGTVSFGGTAVSPTSWSDTEIVFEVPRDATPGEKTVAVPVNGQSTTAGTFTVTDDDDGPEATISANPNPCTIAAGQTTCTTTITWTSENAAAVRVWTEEQTQWPLGYVPGFLTAFTDRDSTSGNKQATIKKSPQKRHKFAVHDHSGGSRGDELASVIVTGVPGPAGTLTPSTGSCTIDPGQSSCSFTLNWTRSNTTRIQVRKKGSTTALTDSTASSGSLQVTVNQGGNTFELYNYAGGALGSRLDSATITGKKPSAPPEITSFTANPKHTKPGATSTLSWQTSNAKKLVLDPGGIDVSEDADNSYPVSPTEIETHTYTLTACKSNCTNDTGTNKKKKTATVKVWAEPTIGSCSASAANVKTGGSSELSWTATNATTVTVNGTSVAVNDSHEVTLSSAGAQTYTVKASNPGWTEANNDDAGCRITVRAWARPTASIEANRTSINEGQPVTLTWSSTNVSSTVISGLGSVAASGNRELTPAEGTLKYEISGANPAWTGDDAAKASVTVTVDARPTGTISASPNPCTIAASASTCTTTVKWSGSGTTGLLVRTSHNGEAERVHASSGRTGSSSPSWIQRSPTHSYVFYLYDYENRVRGARLASVSVRGVKAPVITGLSRSQGNPDTQVTIYGVYFDSTEGTVSFGGSAAEIDSWSDTSIGVLVPPHLGRGTVSVTVTANGLTSNSVNFTVTGDPVGQGCDEDDEDCPEEDEEDEEEESPDP